MSVTPPKPMTESHGSYLPSPTQVAPPAPPGDTGAEDDPDLLALKSKLIKAINGASVANVIDQVWMVLQAAISSDIVDLKDLRWFKRQTSLEPVCGNPDPCMLNPIVERRADVNSSVHITESDYRLCAPDLPHVAYCSRYLTVVKVPDALSKEYETEFWYAEWKAFGLSDEFIRVMRMAQAQNFTHVVLDIDGCVYDNLEEIKKP